MFLSAADIKKIGFKKVGADVRIDASAVFFHPQNISLGSHVRIDGHAMLTATDSIEIGSHVHISWGCLIFGEAPIIFEDFSGLAPRVSIFGGSDDYVSGALTNPTVDKDLRDVKSGPVHLCRHVIIGTGTVISPNVTIGKGTSVGALSHVNRSLPEFRLCIGNPAKPVLPRDKETLLKNEAEMLRRQRKA
jgi:acetyltransferase-like isoleucine patch superfamily enzyme